MKSAYSEQEGLRAMEEILAGKAFTVYYQEGDNVLKQGLQWLLDKLISLFPDLDVPAGTIDLLTYGLMVAGLVALALLVLRLGSRLVRQRRLARRPPPLPEDEAASAEGLLAAARQMGQNEAWREGIRLSFLAILLELERRQWIRLDQWKTNWEYRQELEQGQPALRSSFESWARLFDRGWYGSQADRDGFEKLYGEAAALLKRAGRGGESE